MFSGSIMFDGMMDDLPEDKPTDVPESTKKLPLLDITKDDRLNAESRQYALGCDFETLSERDAVEALTCRERQFREFIAAAQSSAEGWVKVTPETMPPQIIHPEVVAVWTKAGSPSRQVAQSMAIELQMWREWGARLAPAAEEERSSL